MLQIQQHKKPLLMVAGIIVILLVVGFYFTREEPDRKIDVSEYGTIGDGIHNDTAAIQKALDAAKQGQGHIQVVVPKGTYKLTQTLRIYQDTHLLLKDGVVFLRSHDDSMLVNGDPGDMYEGYNGNGNITIEGGVWDGNVLEYPDAFNAIGIARAENVTIRNIEVRDVADDHGIDLNSSKNVLIENSRFVGFLDTSADHSRYFSEAIQVSEHTKLGFSQIGEFDGTPNENVTIRNCYFGASGTKGTTAWPVGIGSHGSVHDQFNSDITLSNNTFDGMTFVGIRIFKWKDTTIQDNSFLRSARGIAFSNPSGKGESSKNADGVQTSLPQSGSNVLITGNTFEDISREMIYAVGWPTKKEESKIESIEIRDNRFNNQLGEHQRPAIFLSWVNDVDISNNTINNAYKGMELAFVSDGKVSDNHFEDITSTVIQSSEPDRSYQLQGYTTGLTFTKNTLSRFGKDGISLQNTTDFMIEDNILNAAGSKDSSHVIEIGAHSKSGQITGNTFVSRIGQDLTKVFLSRPDQDVEISGNKSKIK
ncbi:right-handed parallel beta-helix repeat-containing protein [Neobacillus sp. CF12]|uniref:right-handed parallel beta-helix repeat-containing protein n=1 Tax=Neobacillus sp. CF12 TaxID=3055864 RepID=UPI0025A00D57|nr:right-handed parallel beta-helix repeat-containing protein [Neobacillus sp. CF12]MDM5329823.1 right-handed parallel beta-helix repeat-containing protein [Neobacillus sp. CF12]